MIIINEFGELHPLNISRGMYPLVTQHPQELESAGRQYDRV